MSLSVTWSVHTPCQSMGASFNELLLPHPDIEEYKNNDHKSRRSRGDKCFTSCPSFIPSASISNCKDGIASSLAYKLLFFLYFTGGQSTLIAQFSKLYLLLYNPKWVHVLNVLLKEDPPPCVWREVQVAIAIELETENGKKVIDGLCIAFSLPGLFWYPKHVFQVSRIAYWVAILMNEATSTNKNNFVQDFVFSILHFYGPFWLPQNELLLLQKSGRFSWNCQGNCRLTLPCDTNNCEEAKMSGYAQESTKTM